MIEYFDQAKDSNDTTMMMTNQRQRKKRKTHGILMEFRFGHVAFIGCSLSKVWVNIFTMANYLQFKPIGKLWRKKIRKEENLFFLEMMWKYCRKCSDNQENDGKKIKTTEENETDRNEWKKMKKLFFFLDRMHFNQEPKWMSIHFISVHAIRTFSYSNCHWDTEFMFKPCSQSNVCYFLFT